MQTKKPNILFLFADQMRYDALGCCGGFARTPNLDMIAAEGINFTNCSTPGPLCVPARVCLATGRYAHDTGAWNNSPFTLSPNARTFMRQIRSAGYSTSLIGKTHLHAGKNLIEAEPLLVAYGYDDVCETEGPHANAGSTNHMTNRWRELGIFEAFKEDLKARSELGRPSVKPSSLPLDEYYDTYVGRRGREWIENYKGDKPWFCHISFGGPHEPWDTPEPYASLYRPEDMPAPRERMIHKAGDERPKGVFDDLEAKERLHTSPALAAELRADYAGGVTLIDDQVGQIIEAVKKRGDWDNTIVIFTSDHGEHNGDYGIVHKRTYVRPVVGVPLIIRTPQTAAQGGGRVSDAIVEMSDVGPTMAELAGNPVDYEQFALSLCPIITENAEGVRSYAISECSNEIMYRDFEWKMVINREGECYQLFDLTADPSEGINLAGLPDYQAISDELRLKLLGIILKTSPKNAALAMGNNPKHSKKGKG